ncbi:unnamed protein product [Periconia digitata]|uniref:Small ribosomal subunit protein uS13m n=1 Tax=Periconia digitata TaxID=1303443 RepID=A0A9W4URM9_9PLEO|nr:unnamed protein product [Periconia digitata]
MVRRFLSPLVDAMHDPPPDPSPTRAAQRSLPQTSTTPFTRHAFHFRIQLYGGIARKGTRFSPSASPPRTTLNNSQRSLETIYGVGPKVSQSIMAQFHIHPWAKVGSLKNTTLLGLTETLSNMKLENDLRREVQDNIRRMKDMGSYRGRRHAMGLPVRGQRTRTQTSTARKLNKIERGGSGRVQM